MEADISVVKPKLRNTNLELFRIVTMVLIIAHHYVVNSGLMVDGGVIFENVMSGRSLFLLLLGAWGKTGINCFVLITGYFMCKSQISAKKFFKLYFAGVFYYIVINVAYWFTGYSDIDLRELRATMIPMTYVADGFVPAFLLFFLCVPFLNILLQNLTQRMHIYLLLFLFAVYVYPGTFHLQCGLNMNYISWFIVLYFLAAYIRMYPNALFENTKFWGISSAVCMAFGAASIVVSIQDGLWPYYYLTDSNTFLAVATGVSSFLFFNNLQIPYNPLVNKLASTCYGVLLIHANSNAMRRWLWVDVLNNVGVFYEKWMPLHVIGSTLGIFLICAGIDLLRQKYLEEPFFRCWDRCWDKITEKYRGFENLILDKLKIQN